MDNDWEAEDTRGNLAFCDWPSRITIPIGGEVK